MRIKRGYLSNFAFILVFLLIVFTPIGFHLKVYFSRIFSFSPSELKVEEQVALSDYNWNLYDIQGNGYDFKNTKGKVILVNFWATWCPPCVAEMPSLQKLYNDYGDKVDFVLVTYDDKEKVRNFLSENNYSFPVYFERNNRPVSLASNSIPTTYLIDKKGVIIIKEIGAADWNSSISRNTINGLLE
jgi:thiol-disulfide isomerase/thioredoxin